MREPPNIPVVDLQNCLWEQYGIIAATLEFLPRGADYDAWVYRVESEQGGDFLLKVTTRPLYKPSCLVPRYLLEQGISEVVAPISTRSQNADLWGKLRDWTVLVYPFHNGDTNFTGMTRAQWRETGRIFRRIHETQLPPTGFAALRREGFDSAPYIQWIRDFEREYLALRRDGDSAKGVLLAAWEAHQSTIDMIVASLETLAVRLDARTARSVICHADLHPANLIRNGAKDVYVIDWDEVMLAPKERDFIFLMEPGAEAFWDGYGPCAIDWAALSYFRWERVAQDLIANTQQVFFRDDSSEGARADNAERFADLFVAGGMIDAATAVAARVSGDLNGDD